MSALAAGPAGDGRCVIRAGRPGDEAEARAFFAEALSAASRYRRFMAPVSGLPLQAPARYGQRAPCEAVVLYARIDGQVVGVGEYVADADRERVDLAVAVADAWQGCGIGAALVSRLLGMARRAGFRQAEADLLSDNEPMARILRRAGFVLRTEPGAAAWMHASRSLEAPSAARPRPHPARAAVPAGLADTVR